MIVASALATRLRTVSRSSSASLGVEIGIDVGFGHCQKSGRDRRAVSDSALNGGSLLDDGFNNTMMPVENLAERLPFGRLILSGRDGHFCQSRMTTLSTSVSDDSSNGTTLSVG